MPNWAQLLAKLAEDAKKPIAEGLASVEGVLTPERLAQLQAELANMRLLRRRGEALADKVAQAPVSSPLEGQLNKIIPAAGAATVAGVAAGQPDEAEAITPSEALNATRSLDRMAGEQTVLQLIHTMLKKGAIDADALTNASRTSWNVMHPGSTKAQDAYKILKDYAEKMGTKVYKTKKSVYPESNVLTGPKAVGHYNWSEGGLTVPLNVGSASHEVTHGMTSDLAQKLNLPGKIAPSNQAVVVEEMLNDLFPGSRGQALRSRIMSSFLRPKEFIEQTPGYQRSGLTLPDAEVLANAGAWQKAKEVYGSAAEAEKNYDIIPLMQSLENMAKGDEEVSRALQAYRNIASKREGWNAARAAERQKAASLQSILKPGAKATIPALGAGAGVSALQAQEPQEDYGFKPVEAAPAQDDFGFKPVQAVTEDYGFKPVSGEITAKVGEPSEETINQLMQTQTEQGIPLQAGGKKLDIGRPESISRMKGPGREWGDLLKQGAAAVFNPKMPDADKLKIAYDIANGVFNVGGNVAMATVPMREDQPTLAEAGTSLLSPYEQRPAPKTVRPQDENLQMAADVVGSMFPAGKGAKYLLNLAREAKAAKAAKVTELLGVKEGRNLEQMFADTREAAAGTRYIPRMANPTPQKFTREQVEQTLARMQKEQGGLKITDTRAFPPAPEVNMPGGPKRLKMGEVYEGLNEGWNAPADAARRALSQEQISSAARAEDLKAIANLKSTRVPKPGSDPKWEAKWWKVMGANWFRSMDNWLMENGGRTIVEPIRKAVYAGDAWRSEWAHKADAIFKSVGVKEHSTEATIIGRYLNGELTAPGLTPELRAAGDRLRTEILEPIIKQVRSDPELGELLGPIGYIKDYFPQMERLWRSRYGEENALALIHDVKPERFKARFFKKRQNLSEDPLLDAVTVTRAYLRGSAKTLFDIKGYNAAVEAAKQLPAGAGELFKHAASKYAKTFIGQPSTRPDIGEAEKVLNAVHDWYYKAYIGFNPVSAGINLLQTANTFVKTGTKPTMEAIYLVTHPSAKGRELKDLFIKSGAMSEFRGMEISASLEKSKGKMNDALFYLFGKAEKLNRKIAFNAGYLEAEAKGLSQEACIRHALDVVHDTQFEYSKASQVGYAHIPLIGQFSNYPLKQAEFILKSIKDPASRKRALAMLVLAAATTPSPLGNAIVEQASSLAPGIGPAAKDLFVNPAMAVYTGRKPTMYDIGRRIPYVSGALRTGKFVFGDIPEFLGAIGQGLAPKKKKR